VFVKTRAKEFNYPAGDQNVYTTYEGQGGIPLRSFWRKVLFAAHLGDIKLLMSNDLTTASRVLLSTHSRGHPRRRAKAGRWSRHCTACEGGGGVVIAPSRRFGARIKEPNVGTRRKATTPHR
jgi:hypothetical protein